MESKEKVAINEKNEKDSFGLKIAMAILAVAVVVLTFINAAPFSRKGETNESGISGSQQIVTRNYNRVGATSHSVYEVEGEETDEGKESSAEEISVNITATDAVAE